MSETDIRCERCGRNMHRPEGLIFRSGSEQWPLCHPDDNTLPDCYSMVSRRLTDRDQSREYLLR